MMSDIAIVKEIRQFIGEDDISYLNKYMVLKLEVKKYYDSIKKIGAEILVIADELNIDIPIDYSEKITKLTRKLSSINTLKSNIQLNHIVMEKKYWTTYYKTLHKYKEKHVIKVKHEWDAAFNLAVKEATTKDISSKLEIWKHLIKTTEELYQSTMEIIHSGKKTLSVLMEKKW